MNATPRRTLLFLGALATGLAAYFAPSAKDDTVSVRPSPQRSLQDPATVLALADARSAPLHVRALQPRTDDYARDRSGELFGSPVKEAAQASVPAIPASATPDAPTEPPPIPFKILGRFADDGRAGLFIEFESQNLLARAGDTIGGLYRIESIDEEKVSVRFVPLDRLQSIDLSEQKVR